MYSSAIYKFMVFQCFGSTEGFTPSQNKATISLVSNTILFVRLANVNYVWKGILGSLLRASAIYVLIIC